MVDAILKCNRCDHRYTKIDVGDKITVGTILLGKYCSQPWNDQNDKCHGEIEIICLL